MIRSSRLKLLQRQCEEEKSLKDWDLVAADPHPERRFPASRFIPRPLVQPSIFGQGQDLALDADQGHDLSAARA
jgi:hypothetical protein